jgi:hypothetical protein
MQHQYVGDVGDFGKYGLLRHLCGMLDEGEGPTLSLGINWYRVPDEGGNAGKHIGYLAPSPRNDPVFAQCDRKLYMALQRIVSDHRCLLAVANHGILPSAVFYPDPLVVEGRTVDRERWADAALRRLSGCEVVFVDPDNGLEPESRAGRKHVFYKELRPYVERGQSLVVYHHLGRSRNRSHNEQIASVASKISSELGSAREVISLRYRRGTGRAYFIIPNGREVLFNQRIRSFLCGPWGQQKVRGRPHFQQVL